MSTYKTITNQYIEYLDMDYSYNVSCNLLNFKTNPDLGYRTAGSKAEHEAADYLVSEMEKIGLKNIKKEPFKLDSWTFEKGFLTFIDENNNEQKVTIGSYQINFDTQGEKEFKLVYAGKGRKQDLDKLDVTGKIILIDINQREEWWVNYPALQAKVRGALAVLVSQAEGFSEVDDNALNANDVIGPADAPILSVRKAHADILKQLLQNNKEITIKLDVKSTVEFNKEAYNVTGEIEGIDKDSYIIFSSHYDAYFDGFQDNATAVGIMYGIAKAMIESGYKPQRTIIFTALAAEEWGTSNTRYDWSTGAYKQVFEVHPEWQGKAVLNINFELPAFLHNPFDEITSVNELEDYLVDFVNTVPQVSGSYTEATKVITPLTTWADDFSFSIGGIPAVRNDFTSSNFRKTHYHTEFDNVDTYNEKVFLQHHILYGLLAIHTDYLALPSLNFNSTLNKIKNILKMDIFNEFSDNSKSLEEYLEFLIISYNNLNKKVATINNKYYMLKDSSNTEYSEVYNNSRDLNNFLLTTYRKFQDNFVRLNWEDEPVYTLEVIADNISILEKAISNLKNGNIDKAIKDNIFSIDNNMLAYYFDKEVWDYFNDYVLKAPADRLMWGVGRIVGHIDLYDIINILDDKLNNNMINCEKEIEKLQDIINIQKQLLQKELCNIYNILKILNLDIKKL